MGTRGLYANRFFSNYETAGLCLAFVLLFTKGIPSCHGIFKSGNGSSNFPSSSSPSSSLSNFNQILPLPTSQDSLEETNSPDSQRQAGGNTTKVAVNTAQGNPLESNLSFSPQEPTSVDDAPEPILLDDAQEPILLDDAQEPTSVDDAQEPTSLDDAQEPTSLDDSPLSGPAPGSTDLGTKSNGKEPDGAFTTREESGHYLQIESKENLRHEGNVSETEISHLLEEKAVGADTTVPAQDLYQAGTTLHFPESEAESNKLDLNQSKTETKKNIKLSFAIENTNQTADVTLNDAQLPRQPVAHSFLPDSKEEDTTQHNPPKGDDINELNTPSETEIGGEVLKSCDTNHFCKDRCTKPEAGPSQDTETALHPDGLATSNSREHDVEIDDDDSEEKKMISPRMVCPLKIDGLVGFECSCDEKCIFFGDCCPDMFRECLGLLQTENIINHVTQLRNTTMAVKPPAATMRQVWEGEFKIKQVDDLDQFLLLYGSCVHLDEHSSLLAISKCPEWSEDEELRDACERPSSELLAPLTVVFSGGALVFRNVHCLRCHDMEGTSHVLWETRIKCDDYKCADKVATMSLHKVTQAVKSGDLKVEFTSHLRSCDQRWCLPSSTLTPKQQVQLDNISEEASCTGDDVILCRSYVFPQREVRNPHCEKCLGVNQRPERAAPRGDGMCQKPQHPNGGNIEFPGSLLIILDVTGHFSLGSRRSVDLCPEDSVWDPFVQECKELICKLGATPYRGECIPSPDSQYVPAKQQLFPESWQELKLQIPLSLNHTLNCGQINIFRAGTNFNFEFKIDEFVINSVTSGFLRTETTNSPGNVPCTINYFPKDEVDVDSIGLQARMSAVASYDVLERIKAYAARLSVSTAQAISETVQLSITNQVLQFICPSGEDPIKTDKFYWKLHEDGLMYARVQEQYSERFYQLSNVGLEIILTTDTEENTDWEENVVLCNAEISLLNPNCSLVSYQKNETAVNQSGLYVFSSGQLYEEDQFEIQANRVLVCSDFDFVTREPGGRDTLYIIVSSCLTAASVACLLLMVTIYIYLPELRTLPGQMTATLAACMAWNFLFTQLTVSDLQNKYICPFLAALNHLSVLASFGWMSAIAVNMALTFGPRKLSPMTSAKTSNHFLRYSVLVWGISLLIVTVSVLTDLISHRAGDEETILSRTDNSSASGASSNGDKYPRYGVPFCTWFSGPLWVRLAFILIPYIISFLINVVCFVVTLVSIKKALKDSEKLGKKSSERMRCLIYIKLSTAMGFSWVLSFFVQMEDSEALQYIVVTIMLLQGIFLTLAFMANKRVLTLLRNKIGKGTKYMTSATFTTKTTDTQGHPSSKD